MLKLWDALTVDAAAAAAEADGGSGDAALECERRDRTIVPSHQRTPANEQATERASEVKRGSTLLLHEAHRQKNYPNCPTGRTLSVRPANVDNNRINSSTIAPRKLMVADHRPRILWSTFWSLIWREYRQRYETPRGREMSKKTRGSEVPNTLPGLSRAVCLSVLGLVLDRNWFRRRASYDAAHSHCRRGGGARFRSRSESARDPSGSSLCAGDASHGPRKGGMRFFFEGPQK